MPLHTDEGDINVIKDWYIGQKSRKDYLENLISSLEEQLFGLKKLIELIVMVREKIANIGIETQNKIKSYIENTVIKGLKEVLGKEYAFEVNFEINRNKPEAFLYLIKGKNKYSFDEESFGGGVYDVVSLLMRLVIWAMNYDRTEPFFALDEPFKFLHGEEHIEGIKVLLQELREMGIQFLITSVDGALGDLADRAWTCFQNEKGISYLKEKE